MGMWQTGYLDTVWDGLSQGMPDPASVPSTCEACELQFESHAALRQHLFEKHPAGCPELFIGGRLAGRRGEVIRSPVLRDTVLALDSTAALLNGHSIQPDQLAAAFATVGNGNHRIVLDRDGVQRDYVVQVDIVSAESVAVADKELVAFLGTHEPTVATVAEFARRASDLGCATSYVDAIAQYLYGVLAKDQRGDTTLRREDYVERFNRAAFGFAGHSSLPARAMRTIVAFDRNVLTEPCTAPDLPLLARAFGYFSALVSGHRPDPPKMPGSGGGAGFRLPVDAANEILIRMSFHTPTLGDQMIERLKSWMSETPLVSHDRQKASILLGYWLLLVGQDSKARSVLRGITNDPVFGPGARALIT